ncbi:MAG: 4-hydroxy-tetrahydrodipicolinate reductase [Spirochaetia bacterium]|jgi:4-hydroxy-tetrahydrodipicolinate reductase|nr:4-hydroxy-tetrahydrodipicolinate reductase [Spirochaetia bacterium]
MKIAIVGFGRMGKQIMQLAKDEGHEIVAVVDPWSPSPLVTGLDLASGALSNKADVIIDFSNPASVEEHINYYAREGIPAVIGTTGWYDRLPEVEAFLSAYPECSLIYSSNFSVGVALYRQVVAYAAKLFGNLGTYDVSLHESHHMEKKDSPSGTALLLGQTLLDNFKGKDSLVTERLDRKREQGEIHVSSTRGGWDPGTHTVTFDSPFDTVELIHRARTREGFAKGALVAAEWIIEKKGLYTLDDLVASLVEENTTE